MVPTERTKAVAATTSTTGINPPPFSAFARSQPSKRAGFTLLEITLVIGMVALMAGILMSLGVSSLMEDQGARPAYEIFREATHEGRIQAISQAQVMYLTFDQEAQMFRVSPDGAVAKEEDTGYNPFQEVNRYGYIEVEDEQDVAVAKPEGRTEFPVFEEELVVEFRGLKAGADSLSKETEQTAEPLPYLMFHPSGVSTPAVAVLKYSNGEEIVLTLDTFSNGPQLSLDQGVGY